MLNREQRTTILTLAGKGRSRREIARALGVSRKSVKVVLRQAQASPQAADRGSQLDEHLDEIRGLHATCRDKHGRTNMVWFGRSCEIGWKVKARSLAARIRR